MKAFVELEGRLLLLVSLIWMCSGQKRVLVECNSLNFRAIAKRALFYQHELVGPDELLLGTGCQAIRVRPDELDFDYPISLCGIVTQVFFDGIVIHSWLTYTPRNQLISAELRLECIVPSPSAVPNSTDLSSGLYVPPSTQQWFLVQDRHCVRCGYTHFREHWSTPFYGPRNYSLPVNFTHPFVYELQTLMPLDIEQDRSSPF
ncbi:oocyte-secreted protein 2 [Rousettus aegyptiacus]|uniref:oocyte-secreted protein 2 n=1 Tax=Rousettus aegyptiacus TaxID=9407 RepID=UPI00168CC3A7|nr:oocyte-secreted protein 2 [Rousettus aegyptiacus]